MKKISVIGLALGALLGIMVTLAFGGWLFWLGLGLAIGLVVGSIRGRRQGAARAQLVTESQAGNRASVIANNRSRDTLEESWHY